MGPQPARFRPVQEHARVARPRILRQSMTIAVATACHQSLGVRNGPTWRGATRSICLTLGYLRIRAMGDGRTLPLDRVGLHGWGLDVPYSSNG